MAILDILPWGISGALLIVLIYGATHPEAIEKWAANLAAFFSWANERLERAAVADSVQADVNSFSKSTEKVVPSSLPFGIRIKWISEEQEEGFLEKEQVVVLLRHHKNNARNLAMASFLFMSAGLLPSQRLCIDDDFMRALEVSMAEKLLTSRKRADALRIFESEVRSKVGGGDVGELCNLIRDLESKGLFFGILIPELAKLATKYQDSESEALRDEVRRFANFLRSIALRQRGEILPSTRFEGRYIRIGVILVGMFTKVLAGSPAPYLGAISYSREHALDTSYLLAWANQNIALAKKAIRAAENTNFGKLVASRDFTMVDDRGRSVRGIVDEFLIYARPEDAVSLSPRGTA